MEAANEAKREAYEKEKRVAGELFQLACTGPVEKFKFFINERLGGDMSLVQQYKDGNSRTPLHFAAFSGQKDICQFILEQNSTALTTSQKDAEGYSAFGLAIRSGHADIVQLIAEQEEFAEKLLEDEVNLENTYNAAASGSTEVLKFLLEKGGVKFMKKTLDHGSILHGAVFAATKPEVDNLGCVDLLLAIPECDLNLADPEGITPLMVAVGGSSMALVDKLLEKGASLSLETKGGSTVFHTAVETNNGEMTSHLIDKLKDDLGVLLKRNSNNLNVFELAVVRNHESLFTILYNRLKDSKVEKDIFPDDSITDFSSCKSYLEAKDMKIVESHQDSVAKKIAEAVELKAIGNSLLQKGDLSGSLEDYSKAVKILSQCLTDLENSLLTVCFEKARAIFTDSYLVPVQKALCLVLNNRSMNNLKKKNLSAAVEDGKRAKQLDPANLKSYYRLGQAHESLKEYADAAQAYWDGFTYIQDHNKKAGVKIGEDESKLLFDLFQEAVEKGKGHERRKIRQQTYDFNVPIEVPIDALGVQFKTLDLKFNKQDNEVQVAGEFIRKHSLHPSLIERIAKHIFEVKHAE